MNRAFQAAALCISIGMLAFLACRAQQKPAPAPAPVSSTPDAGAPAPDAAAAEPEVYFPASKSGGAFLQHQQAPN